MATTWLKGGFKAAPSSLAWNTPPLWLVYRRLPWGSGGNRWSMHSALYKVGQLYQTADW